jgi:transcriptional regulator of arginine metabolism
VPLVPVTKAARQARIVELLEARPVSSQTELGRLLAASGVEVTQATLSRDLDELSAVKVRTAAGMTYAVPPEGQPRKGTAEAVDARLGRGDRWSRRPAHATRWRSTARLGARPRRPARGRRHRRRR